MRGRGKVSEECQRGTTVNGIDNGSFAEDRKPQFTLKKVIKR